MDTLLITDTLLIMDTAALTATATDRITKAVIELTPTDRTGHTTLTTHTDPTGLDPIGSDTTIILIITEATSRDWETITE